MTKIIFLCPKVSLSNPWGKSLGQRSNCYFFGVFCVAAEVRVGFQVLGGWAKVWLGKEVWYNGPQKQMLLCVHNPELSTVLVLMMKLKIHYFNSCQLPRWRHGAFWDSRPYGRVNNIVSVILHICLLLLPSGRRGLRPRAGGMLHLFLLQRKMHFSYLYFHFPTLFHFQVFFSLGSQNFVCILADGC